ncbi:putative serine/threonine-protein kinase iks1 [Dinochytrium kinnereticum]|nr:putative serine/threonine-protein kinase iks1 [Dinochytrium kinnereticum]
MDGLNPSSLRAHASTLALRIPFYNKLLLEPPSQSRAVDGSHLSASPSALSSWNQAGHRLLVDNANNLIPYADWQVILHNETSGQLVLWNGEEKRVVVRRLRLDVSGHLHETRSGSPDRSDDETQGGGICPQCGQTVPSYRGTFAREDYFRFLELEFATRMSEINEETAEDLESSMAGSNPPSPPPEEKLSDRAFNQGYYERFFIETKKLGRGQRGSVYLVQHVLDSVYLGDYACKSIPIGVSHSWLVRQLQEVHLLERLRHPNIIHYKHAWIENKQLTNFGPEVPCLFILMELANGGNLEEYIQIQAPRLEPSDPSTQTPSERARRVKLLREQQRRNRTGAGSAQQHHANETARVYGGIGVGDHGDRKPPNLLLQFDNPQDPDEIPRVLISDFGECEVVSERTPRIRSGATGTLEFMCPELLERDELGKFKHDHSPYGDMFSLGVILYYLCYSRVPYSQVDDVDLLKEEILAFEGVHLPEEVDHRVPIELKHLMVALMSRDAESRPSIESVISSFPRRPSRKLQTTPIPSQRTPRQRGLSFTSEMASSPTDEMTFRLDEEASGVIVPYHQYSTSAGASSGAGSYAGSEDRALVPLHSRPLSFVKEGLSGASNGH